MEKERKGIERRELFLLISALVLASGLVIVALGLLFGHYRQTVLESQSDQLMNITQSVSHSLEVYLEEFQQLAVSYTDLDQFEEAEKELGAGDSSAMATFLDEAILDRQAEIASLSYEDATGRMVASGEAHTYTLFKSMGSSEIFTETTTVTDEDGAFYFCLLANTSCGGRVRLYLPMTVVYEKTAAYIQMGENGYVMIKDSDGIILMHQSEGQIGMDVLADRKELYPELDYSELEVLIAHQLAGLSGVEIYHSYWWIDDPPTRSQKVSAYMPVGIAGDFLVVSAVMDYEEIIGPVQSVGIRILILTTILVVIFLTGGIFLWSAFTRRRKTERENRHLRHVNEQLEQLRIQEEKLAHQQRLQLIGTMTGGIAHEFNNLLAPIMGYSALILADMPETDERYEDMREILDSAEKAKEIIDQITQFSRKNAEKMREPTHIARVIEKALVITDTAKPANITLLRELETENDLCLGNALQLRQLLVNLTGNALHAMAGAGGTLTVRGSAEGDFYRITVSDTGCGMSKETLEQIFIPFFTTKKVGEGTGLGLAIVQRLVEAHDGTIEVSSTEGVGTVFTIRLPLLRKEK